MKICFISLVCNDSSGIGRRVLNIAKNLNKIGNEVHVITLNIPENIDLNEAEKTGLFIHKVPSFKIKRLPPRPITDIFLFSILSFFKYRKLDKAHRFDVVELQQCHSMFLHKTLKVPLIIVNHGTIAGVSRFNTEGNKIYNLFNFLFAKVEESELKAAKLIIPVSNSVKNEIINFYNNNENIQTIHNGFNSGNFFKTDVIKDPNIPILLSVGMLTENKNVIVIFNIVKILKNKFPNIKLIVVGTGPQKSDLIKFCRTNNLHSNIEFIPFADTEKLNILYNLSDILVLLSKYESFGLVVLEAMACGTPVVVSRSGGLPEVVEDAGIIVDTFDHNEIADKILNLLSNPELKAKLSEKSVIQANKFTWEKIGQKYNSILHNMVKHGR